MYYEMSFITVTGASSGIGRATALKFAKKGFNLVIIARNQSALSLLKKQILEIDSSLDIIVYSLDLSNKNSLDKLITELDKLDIDILINNAGFGITGNILDNDSHKVEQMIDLNVESLVVLSMWFAKKYKQFKNKQLLNVSSTAGYDINMRAVLYAATKNFVATFTEGLALELRHNKLPLQAKVIAPYATETNFAKNSLGTDTFSYKDNYNKFHTPDQMADCIVTLLESNKVVGKINSQTLNLELSDVLLNWSE